MREKGTDEDLLNVGILTTDMSRAELEAECLCTHVGNKAYYIKTGIHDAMKDLSSRNMCQGLVELTVLFA